MGILSCIGFGDHSREKYKKQKFECICSFQWAMRRLAQIINQAQTYCTEDECNPGDQQNTGGGGPGDNPMFLMMMFAIFAMMMFMMRPKSKNERNEKQPPGGSGFGGGNNQPPPDIST